MGFKVESSFLKYLTMGALASQRVMELMTAAGLRPIELERYCTSNKIWATKVKRLRLPDLLCVRTGLRVEVRAKSVLAIRMSDAPDNPARRWSSSVQSGDMVAFVECVEDGTEVIPAKNAELFWVEHLLASEDTTKLGQPKSASEGSERDREWKTIVPSRSGKVVNIDNERIKVLMDDGRPQTYKRSALNAYVTKDQRFTGRSQFIAGTPIRKAQFSEVIGRHWDPRHINNADVVDRYVQAKSLSAVGTSADIPFLKKLAADTDPRVALEAAGSLAKLGNGDGMAFLEEAFRKPAEPYLAMEAVFLLAELAPSPMRTQAVALLDSIARDPALTGNEVRQAAIWGLGRAGLQAYERLLDFLDADDQDERLHALVSFGANLPDETIRALVAVLSGSASAMKKSAVVHVLSKLLPSEIAVRELATIAISGGQTESAWAKAALGSLAADAITKFLENPELTKQLVPIQLISPSKNWTKRDEVQQSVTSLTKQAALLR